MKSIKEKSNEYAKEFIEPFVLYYSQDEVKQFEAQHEDSFEAGANYVLEEVDDILYRRYSDDGDPNQRWIDMKKLIESLKK